MLTKPRVSITGPGRPAHENPQEHPNVATTGVAHHQSRTRFQAMENPDECAARAARFASRDATYRAALGVAGVDPLPRSIGNVHHNHGSGVAAQASGGAMRTRTRPAL